jgi:tetratricopeptide (TPR) repeat protein
MANWTTHRTVALAALLAVGAPMARPHVSAEAIDVLASAVPACTVEQGQNFIDEGRYEKAIAEFSCVIDAQPTGVEGYRGRIEAELLLGRFSDAVGDYTRVTSYVVPVHPDAGSLILAGYAERLAAAPNDVAALTGASFARWWLFQYAQAIQQLHTLLAVKPDDLYGTLFRGSSRLLRGATPAQGIADLEHAIALAPDSPDVRFIVADAYTYGLPDPNRALAEATFALEEGLDTPRVHAIIAAAYHALGDEALSAAHIARHLELVTTELVVTSPLAAGSSMSLMIVPGRTFEIPMHVTAGQTLSLMTSSQPIWDTILLVLGPDGTPLVGSDDYRVYYAGLLWTAPATATYRVRVSSFEAATPGEMLITRK